MITKIEVNKCVCDKCGHEWITRNEEIPKVCSKCKSVNWNKSQEKPEVDKDFDFGG